MVAPYVHPTFRLVSECRFCHQESLHYILDLRRSSALKPVHGAVRGCPDCGNHWFEVLDPAA